MDYPEQVIRIMRPQIVTLKCAVSWHFKNRHDGRGNGIVRMWLNELRRIDKASGYREAVKQLKG